MEQECEAAHLRPDIAGDQRSSKTEGKGGGRRGLNLLRHQSEDTARVRFSRKKRAIALRSGSTALALRWTEEGRRCSVRSERGMHQFEPSQNAVSQYLFARELEVR